MMRYILSCLLLVVVLLGAYWVVKTYRAPGSMTVIESQAMDMSMEAPAGSAPVALETVKTTLFQPGVTLTGSVLAWADEEVVARLAGRVLKLEVYPGDRVAAGQLVAVLDSAEIAWKAEAAQASALESEYRQQAAREQLHKSLLEVTNGSREIEKAKFDLNQTAATRRSAEQAWRYQSAEFGRSQQLYQAGALSLEEFQKSRSDLAEARAELDVKELDRLKARASLDQAQRNLQILRSDANSTQAEIGALGAQTRKNLADSGAAQVVSGYTQLRALQPGVVVERMVSPGTLVQPGQTLLKLKSLDKVRVQARVPQDYAGRIERGARVLVKRGSQKIEARVTSDFVAADPVSRTFTIEAAMTNLSGKKALRAGEYVEMQISLEAPQRMVTLPVSAVLYDLQNRPYVWLAERSASPGEKPSYTCVMHPEVHEPKPGPCPKCGMPLHLESKGGPMHVVKRPVKVAGVDNGRVGVRAGLDADMQVVVAGYQTLHPGDPITNVPWSSQGPVELTSPASPSPAMDPNMPGMKP